MVIAALKGWAVPTKELCDYCETDEDGTDMASAAKCLRLYGLEATYCRLRPKVQQVQRHLRAGYLVIASVRLHNVPHAVVVSGVDQNNEFTFHDPSVRGYQYRRFASEYVLIRVPPRFRNAA